jgi:HEPN domain-containing protein
MEIEERRSRIERYLEQSLNYLENASEALVEGYPEKAGEFLWGSVASALKALVMAKKGVEIRSHREFWEVARELVRETGDESIYRAFREANSLHSNFYDSRLTVEDIRMVAPEIRELIEKLRDLSKQALKELESSER